MLTYSQTTGELRAADGHLIGAGFSGFEHMRNRPQFEDTLHGPIPKRVFDIFLPRRAGDSWVLLLKPQTPVARTAYGQFSIQTGDISYGCINLEKEDIEKVVQLWHRGERTLKVTF